MQILLDDMPHHGVDEHVVGAVCVLDMDVGALGHPGLARIAYHHLGSLAQRLLHLIPDDGVRFGGIGADDEERLHILDFVDGVGHGAGAERCRQPGNGGRVAGGGALIDIVGLARRTGDLLHQEILFIGAAAGAEKGEAFRSVLVANLRQAFAGVAQGLLPGGFTKLTVLTDERAGQAFGRMHELGSETPLHARVAVIDHRAHLAGDAHQAVGPGIDVEVDLAAHPAIGAGGSHFLEVLGSALTHGRGFPQGPSGTGAHTEAAEFTGGLVQRQVEGSAYPHVQGAALQCQGLDHGDLGADLHTELAAYTLGGIVGDALVAVGINCLFS